MSIVMQLAWRNLWRNSRRTWLTIAAIAFSTTLLVSWVPIQFGVYEIMIDGTLSIFPGHAQIQRPGYQDKPKIRNAIDNAQALAEKLRVSQYYKGISVRAQGFALLSSGTRSYGGQVVGVEPTHEPGTSSIPGLIKKGKYLSHISANEIVIGSTLAHNLRLDIGDEVTLLGSGKDGSIAAAILTVSGIFSSGSNDLDRFLCEIPLHTFQDIFSMGQSAHSIVIVGHKLEQQAQLITHLQEAIRGLDQLVVLGWEDLVAGLKEGIEIDKVSGFIFQGILMAILIFSILNTFLMSILERTREFGLMLSLGTSTRRIAGLLMLETALLTLIGLIIGMIIGSSLVYWAHTVGISYPGLEEMAKQYNMPGLSRIYPQVKLINFLLGPIAIFITTNIVAWIPILRIRKLQPVEAMRTV